MVNVVVILVILFIILGFVSIRFIMFIMFGGKTSKQADCELEQQEQYLQKIREICIKHQLTLSLQYKKCQTIYGTLDKKKWDSEVEHFIECVIGNPPNWVPYEWIKQEIEVMISRETQNLSSITNGYEFEEYCAGVLRDLGYDVVETKKSGDQGADIIATKDGKEIAIQCKYYLRPVGNKAVQEIEAARKFYKTKYAAVITNSTFTSHAMELANSCGVLLINIADIENLMFYLKQKESEL
ncbi:restriction endonuclease [uncultured Helicobacter sp.]|uniref:restriction endonuclease n=1 Tax=uncultured Helicobacter sp. TaxID=175537 RepID=UPI003751A925